VHSPDGHSCDIHWHFDIESDLAPQLIRTTFDSILHQQTHLLPNFNSNNSNNNNNNSNMWNMRNPVILLLAVLPWAMSNDYNFEDEEDRELQVSFDDPNDYFDLYTEEEDWVRCNVEYEENCFPTVSIEEAACRAELIVWGRIIDENSAGDRKISVNWLSYVHDKPRRTVQKWGAGLDNSLEANTTFSTDSGEFHTWVSGFSTDGCGTRAPIDGSEAYFFLESLPENAGIDPRSVVIENFQKDININFKLVATAFGSGVAGLEDYKYFSKFRFGGGDCEKIACCYRSECAACAEYDVSECEYTTFVPSGGIRVNFVWSAAAAALGLVTLLI
jgi:hypothetical protein